MKVDHVDSEDELIEFFSRQKHIPFLQSWGWSDVLKSTGKDILRLGIRDDHRLIGVASLSRQQLPARRSLLYCARGPFFDRETTAETRFAAFTALIESLKTMKYARDAIAFRYEPHIIDIKMGKRTIDVQPSLTRVLDLKKSEDELIKAMHQKTRYNIRLAERKGVKVEYCSDREAVDIFWSLLKMTTKRDGFRPHPKSHYETTMGILGKSDFKDHARASARIDIARYKGKPIAANLINAFSDTMTYVHGASSNEHREVMAPHLLQWRSIQEARAAGYRYYDFHGITASEDPGHPWSGLTRFKKGFGGEVVELPGTYDIVFSWWWYFMYKRTRQVIRSLN